jgi:hypothetical protein
MNKFLEPREITLLLYALVEQLGANHERCAEELGIPLAQS